MSRACGSKIETGPGITERTVVAKKVAEPQRITSGAFYG